MTEFSEDSYSDAELDAEFDRLFPQGFAGPDVVHELAPNGWENSPLVAVFHTSAEQVFDETLRIHRNIAAMRKENDPRPMLPEPTLGEVARDHRIQPFESVREISELVGLCLWDVFSDAHEVFSADGRLLDLGSFRRSGEFLAELLNRQSDANHYDYLDFYLGTIHVASRADLGPVYRLIFRRLRGRELEWVYHFPRIYAIDFAPLKDALDQKDGPDWLNYSPSEALAKEEEQKRRAQELAEFRQSLDEGYREAIDDALKAPPPCIVQAYAAVYGCYPHGWPPTP
jgi:hypothetical protein